MDWLLTNLILKQIAYSLQETLKIKPSNPGLPAYLFSHFPKRYKLLLWYKHIIIA